MSAGTPIVLVPLRHPVRFPNRLLVAGKAAAPSSVAFAELIRWGRLITQAFNRLISLGDGTPFSNAGNLDAQWISGPPNSLGIGGFVFPAVPNTTVDIPHGLGRTPVGYLVVRYFSGACKVFDAPDAAWSPTDIFLQCDTASAQVALLIF